MATELEKAEPAKFNEAVQALLTKVIKEHKAIDPGEPGLERLGRLRRQQRALSIPRPATGCL